MPSRIGTSEVSFRLGSAAPVSLYAGESEVWAAIGVPGSPTNVTAAATGEGDNVLVTWATPPSNGSEITLYKAYYGTNPASLAFLDTGITSPWVWTSGGPYVGQYVAITATNEFGEGPQSTPVLVQPYE